MYGPGGQYGCVYVLYIAYIRSGLNLTNAYKYTRNEFICVFRVTNRGPQLPSDVAQLTIEPAPNRKNIGAIVYTWSQSLLVFAALQL